MFFDVFGRSYHTDMSKCQSPHPPIATVQTLAPNVISTRWHCSYPGYFGFISGQWEEVETRRPSLYADYDHDHLQQLIVGVMKWATAKIHPHRLLSFILHWTKVPEGTDRWEWQLTVSHCFPPLRNIFIFQLRQWPSLLLRLSWSGIVLSERNSLLKLCNSELCNVTFMKLLSFSSFWQHLCYNLCPH